jgi:hypothetical protein
MAKLQKTAVPASAKLVGIRTDWDDFLDRLPIVVDGGKLSKALAMLRAERFQLFAEVHPGHISDVVRSQSSASRVYACRLAIDGRYSCCTQNLIQCWYRAVHRASTYWSWWSVW